MEERGFTPDDILTSIDPSSCDEAQPCADGGLDREALAARVNATDALIDELTATARAKATAVTLATVELVDAIAQLEPYEGRIAATMRQWVSWQCGLTAGETRRVFRLVERLSELPLLDAAFRAGELSDDVVACLTQVATPDNEAALLDAARDATGAQLSVLVRDFRAVQRAEATHRWRTSSDAAADAGSPDAPAAAAGVGTDDDPAALDSEAWWRWDDDGRFRGGWDLNTPEGARMEAALEAELARLRPSERDIDDASPPVEGDVRPQERPRVRRSDALVGLADSSLAGSADDGMLPETHQVIVRRDAAPGGTAVLEGAGAIPRWLVDYLSCDSVELTVEMIEGFPVSEPTMVRSFNRRQRRALRARDRHCQFPGCNRRRHLHAHHTQEWNETHRTSVAHGLLLCGQHHALVHRLGYHITRDPDGAVTLERPDGTRLRTRPPPRPPAEQCARAADPSDRQRRIGMAEPLTYEARSTLVTHWLDATRAPP
jgi:hypothetical protein